MLCRNSIIKSGIITALCAGALFAQGGRLTVSKDPDNEGMFRTIQEAVNAANMGDIIEILDTEIYEEQVTIDGRENTPWNGQNQGPTSRVVGRKHGITIRSRNPTDRSKPTIRWQDTLNSWPRTQAQAASPGELPGRGCPDPHDPSLCAQAPGSGNFETAGALRIIRASGVTIDGIIIDGGGAAPFGWEGVWGAAALSHGNAAITLVVSSDVTIRNCDIRNGYFGINIKDRNIGGVYGNPNPRDTDHAIPLSGFGLSGNHLIEHNRIHNNSVGLFVESAWDLGSSVRYNLFYDNHHSDEARAILGIAPLEQGYSNAGSNFPDVNNMTCGAIMIKDMLYSPLAIYNNTFFRNYKNIIHHWKIGGQMLVFNNIFGPSPVQYIGRPNNSANYAMAHMAGDGRYTNRMHNNTFAVYTQMQVQSQEYFLHQDCVPPRYDTLWISDFDVWNQFPKPAQTPQIFDFWAACPAVTNPQHPNGVSPGALLTGGANGFPATSSNRWLEPAGLTGISNPHGQGTKTLSLPNLFQDTVRAGARFLWPDWNHHLVETFIRNKGWETEGGAAAGASIRNVDGQIADLGAIPSPNGRQQTTVARIRPTAVVTVNGTQASASFNFTVESGSFNNPAIKYLRWVSPLPPITNDHMNYSNFGSESPIISSGSIHRNVSIPSTPVRVGSNSMTFTIPPLASSDTGTIYGFFEMTIEGTDANGNLVTSDVGFLPYRDLNYRLRIEVVNSAGIVVPNPEVVAGELTRIRVTAEERTPAGWVAFNRAGTTRPLDVTYTLFSDPTSRMWRAIGPPRDPLEEDALGVVGDRYMGIYNVYFTRAGDETINGAGIWCDRDCQQENALRLGFNGGLNLRVLPGPPAGVAFVSPIPRSQIPQGTLPPTIGAGQEYEAMVEVQDEFGNAVGAGRTVTLRSERPGIGDVHSRSATGALEPAGGAAVSAGTDSTGTARFIVMVTNGAIGDTLDLRAGLPLIPTAGDTGWLRVGRPSNMLRILYHNTVTDNTWRPDWNLGGINGAFVGQWRPVYIKATSTDTVLYNTSTFVCVTVITPGLLLSSTEGGTGSEQISVPMTNGVATIWVSADRSVSDGGIEAVAKRENDCAASSDNSLARGERFEINFEEQQINIAFAEIHAAANGHGRPDKIRIQYAATGDVIIGTANGFLTTWPLPDAVDFRWPDAAATSASVTVPQSRITAIDELTYEVDLSTFANDLPIGFTTYGNAANIIRIHGGHALSSGNHFDVPVTVIRDSIGPIITAIEDGHGRINPRIIENLDEDSTVDTLLISFTELLPAGRETMLAGGASLLVTSDTAGMWDDEMATGGTPVTVLSAQEELNMFRFVLPRGAVDFNHFVRINPAHGIIDDNGAAVSVGNRWVRVGLSEKPPTVRSARYIDSNADGLIDTIFVTFDKNVTSIDDWFRSIVFGWGAGVAGTADITACGGCVTMGAADNTIAIAVESAFPAARARVRTGGNITMTINYVMPPEEWPPASVTADDNAAPVLYSARLLIGREADDDGPATPSTLEIVYSENLLPALLTGADLTHIDILNNGSWRTPTLANPRASDENIGGVTYRKVTYDVTDMAGIVPAAGDSARINIASGIADDQGNSQLNPANRRVPLSTEVDIEWRVNVRNNPFPSGGQATVVIRTGAAGEVEFKTTFTIFDNMGNIVISETKTESRGEMTWTWNGRNRHGRAVGTGTYLLRTVSELKSNSGAEITKPRHTENNKIGFVRRTGGI